MSSLDGHTVTRAELQIPAWGVWWADVEIDTADHLAGDVELQLADVTCRGTIISGGPAEGGARYRIAGGKGRWGKGVPRKSYANDAGIKASTVLGDAAAACGETLLGAPSTRLGPHYARADGPASRVLNTIAPRGWYVGLDGVTRIGQRPTAAFVGDAAAVRTDRAVGVVELAVESIAGLEPGVTYDGVSAVDVEISQDASRITARLYGSAPTTRRLSALQGLIDQLYPDLRYRGAFEFRVVTQSGERLNLQPARVSLGFPDLSRVPVRPGLSGSRSDVALGSLVLVQFVNANPARPVVTSFDSPDNPGWSPLVSDLTGAALRLGGEAAVLGVARLTDAVVAGPFAGVVTAASTSIKAAG